MLFVTFIYKNRIFSVTCISIVWYHFGEKFSKL